jgi:hypothetical protein
MKKYFMCLLLVLLPLQLMAQQAIVANNQVLPAYLSTGFNFISAKTDFALSQPDRADVKFSDDLGYNKSGCLTEWWISGNVGNFSARYYHMFPKSFNGSGSLKNSIFIAKPLTPPATSTVAIVESSLVDSTATFSSNRIEAGIPLYFQRQSVVIEPFIVGEWHRKEFTLATTKPNVDLSNLCNRINSTRSALIGPGIAYRQIISNNLSIDIKGFRAYSELNSSLTFFDIKSTVLLLGNGSTGCRAAVGYTYRNYDLGQELTRLQILTSGPYVEVGFTF